MNRYDRHAEREWRQQMEERDQFYVWDNPPKKTRVPRRDDERTLLVMVVLLALIPIAVGLIVWVML